MADCLSQLLGHYAKFILDSLSDGVFISDVAGKTIYINRMYEQLTGIRQKDVQGKNVRLLVQEGVFDHILNPEIVRTREPVTHTQQLGNGTRLVLSGYPVFDEEGTLRLVVTFARDVTRLASLQSQVDAQHQLIDQISGHLAHIDHENNRQEPVFAGEAMRKTMELTRRFADTDATVLILGETGVGKDVFGRYLHSISARKDKIMLKVDCGGLAESLAESELFGYQPGAFTGASSKGKTGYFEIADGSTIFLDEIGELPLSMQTRLLRVLQDGEIVRVGSSKPRKIDVRVIAATNRDLAKCVEDGTFRRDLFYRLNVATLRIPPLRERPEDILPLAEHYLTEYTAKYHKSMAVMDVTLDLLLAWHWPGNVRELQNMIHIRVITQKVPLITPDDLPIQISPRKTTPCSEEILAPRHSLKEIVAEMERDFLRKAVEAHGSVQKVAELYKVNRSTIFRKLRMPENW